MRASLILLFASACAASPTYEADVAPIVRNTCASAECHGGAEPTTGLDLSEGVAYDQLVDVASAEAPGVVRVAPGDPDASYLMAKVTGTHIEAGGSGDIMPPPFGLGSADIEAIRAWIEAGALER